MNVSLFTVRHVFIEFVEGMESGIRNTYISGPHVAPKENSLKKFTEANFSNLVSYLLYTYEKKSTEKL